MPLNVPDAVLATQTFVRPSATIWSRLEVLPTSSDYAPALAAEIADPLWLMARQWQFNEFSGEDAGSPIDVRLSGNQFPLQRFRAGPLSSDATVPVQDYEPQAAPLEW